MPGNPAGTIPPTPSTLRDRVQERLDAQEDAAAELERQALGRAFEPLQRAELARAGVEASTLGRINTALDRHQAAGGKMVRKMVNRADQHLSNAYSQIYAYGGVYPSIERVAEGLQTGDSLGTMGVAELGQIGRIEAINAQPAADGAVPAAFVDVPDAFGGGVPKFNAFAIVPAPGPIEPPGRPGRPVQPPVVPPPGAWQPPFLGGGVYVLCLNPATGRIEQVRGRACPVGWQLACWDDEGHGVPGLMSRDNTIEGCRVLTVPPETQPPTQPPTEPPTQPPTQPPQSVCPPGYERLFLLDGQPPPANAIPTAAGWCVPIEPTPPPPATCPVPQPPSCGPAFEGDPIEGIGDAADVCEAIIQAIIKTKSSAPSIRKWIGMAFGSGGSGTLFDAITTAVLGTKEPIIASLVNRFATWIEKVVQQASKGVDCDRQALLPIIINQAALGVIEKWTGAIPDQVLKSLEHLSNTICQSQLPGGPEADNALLADAIDRKVWECWHKAAGNFLEPADKLLQSKRTRPDAIQVSQLHRRKQLTDDEYKKRIRGLGVIEEKDREAIYNLTQSWPGIEDVVRFLVRDVADPKIVERFKMDEDFADKWQGQLIDYAKAVGVPEELGKYYWRAHWHIPSYTQLSEMLHRLRPGRVAKALEVDEGAVEAALKQDDYLPFWVNRMMAISYRVITRTDAVRSFMLRVMKEEELKEVIQDEGYTAKDAQMLVDFYKAVRKRDEIKRSGLPTTKVLLNKFAAGYIAQDTFEAIVRDITLTPEEAQTVLDSAEKMTRIRHREAVVKGIKKQFCAGLIDEGEAQAELADANVPARHIGLLMDEWKYCIKATGKHAGAGQLCDWFKNGIIGAAQMTAALKRVGWSNDDATRITLTCQRRLILANQKEAQRILRQQQADAEKQAKAIEKARKKICTPKKPPPCEPTPKEDQPANGQTKPGQTSPTSD
jgi:hypothetical protein